MHLVIKSFVQLSYMRLQREHVGTGYIGLCVYFWTYL